MSRWIDADALIEAMGEEPYVWNDELEEIAERNQWLTDMHIIENAPSIDLDDYVPKEFHDKTCEAMAQRHQEEIANMASIVRCKECAYWEAPGACLNFMTEDKNGFCSWAERRE